MRKSKREQKNKSKLQPINIEEDTMIIVAKHKGQLYNFGIRFNLDTDQGLHSAMVDLEKLIMSGQKTLFYGKDFGNKPENLMFDMEADEEHWIMERPQMATVDVAGGVAATEKELDGKNSKDQPSPQKEVDS